MKTLFTVLLFTLSLLTVSAAPVTVFNCGIGGHNSRQGNQRLVPLLQQKLRELGFAIHLADVGL